MTSSQDQAAQLSKLEKLALLSGKSTWESRAIPRIGLRSIWMSDGPHGVRRQMGSADHLGLNASQPATCFPTAATIANSWDPELAEQVGVALGRESVRIGVDVLLGPGLNIKRSPLGGRNFEYFSEDPYLAGKFGAAYVRGIQSAGIAACPKHYAVNSQETRRMTSNSVLDEATLREIYLTAFEIVVKESQPKTIMSSYNLVNGTYANEHRQLLTEILREEWGFDGAVITDWGGGNDPKAAIEAGGTLEMPSPGFDSVAALLDDGTVDPDAVNARVAEMIELVARIQPTEVDDSVFETSRALAQHAAEQSIVLLKNEDNILPLDPATRVAVIGEFAYEPRYQGAGSSLVNPTQLTTPIEALRASGLDVVAEAQGFSSTSPRDPQRITEALAAARAADVVLLYLGLDGFTESEGKDRDNMALPADQVELLEAVSAANPNVVVVFAGGSPVEMPWLSQTRALVHGYLAGQAGAQAMVRVLDGSVNPSGRLAETYAYALADTPTAGNFPALGRNSLYREGPFVGYRYYATSETPVRFPFGFGLSYTTFEYSHLQADGDGASVTVTNIGAVAGSEVAQFYATPPTEARKLGPTPSIKLVGFRKVHLEPGESATVRIAFDEYSFRAFDRSAKRWVTVAGDYTIAVGPNVAELAETATIAIAGEAPTVHLTATTPAYSSGKVQGVTDVEFEALLEHPIPGEGNDAAPLGLNSPLSDLKNARSGLGRLVSTQYFARGMAKMEKTGEPDLNLLFQYHMPFRAIYKMSGGLADRKLTEGVLTLVNGNLVKGLGQVIGGFFSNRKRQKQLSTQFSELAEGSTTTGANS